MIFQPHSFFLEAPQWIPVSSPGDRGALGLQSNCRPGLRSPVRLVLLVFSCSRFLSSGCKVMFNNEAVKSRLRLCLPEWRLDSPMGMEVLTEGRPGVGVCMSCFPGWSRSPGKNGPVPPRLLCWGFPSCFLLLSGKPIWFSFHLVPEEGRLGGEDGSFLPCSTLIFRHTLCHQFLCPSGNLQGVERC